MFKVLCLVVFPPLVLFIFIIYTYILLYWHQFTMQKSLYKFNYLTKISSKKLEFFLFEFFRVFIWVLVVLNFFLSYIMVVHNITFKMFYINSLISYQIFVFLCFITFVCYILITSPHFLLGKSLDVGLFFIFTVFLSLTIFISNNILILFINLEIINILVIYSFFITSYFNMYAKKNLNFQINWMFVSTVYQFILNFFSSIIFYLIFNILLINFSTTNFLNLNFFYNTPHYLYDFYITVLFLCIFIKFGIGPWIFFKIEIYQGYNLFLLMFYTLLYFLVILVFFFNLFIIYGANIGSFFLLFLFLFVIITVLYFLFNIFFYFNLFMFFSFSSLLNLVLFLFQWSVYLLI